MRAIVLAVFAGLGLYGASWSSGLWDGKDGILWGVLSSGLFGFFVSLVSGVSKVAFEDLTKRDSSKGVFGTVLNVALAVVTAFVGYKILLLGWHHWWTGFWASALLGLPGLLIGFFGVIASVVHCLLAIAPKRFWGKFVK